MKPGDEISSEVRSKSDVIQVLRKHLDAAIEEMIGGADRPPVSLWWGETETLAEIVYGALKFSIQGQDELCANGGYDPHFKRGAGPDQEVGR
jgi:hypothetical protein